MRATAVKIEGVWKQYQVGATRRFETFYETLTRAMKAPASWLARAGRDALPDDTFWALQDLSFEIAQGDVVGIIGRNGAGKSTLLKVLSRITAPTKGRVEIRGRLASLLEVGTGFHPELTGRENVFLNGAILGMGRREILRKFDEIVEFAEVAKFIDTPVKRYSSGMYVRLAFAVAAHLDSDVLLVDEVLAVGDVEFQEKCLGRMRDVSGEGRTVLFVSHNMGMVNELCGSCVLLEQGRVRSVGAPGAVIHDYFASRTSAGGFTFVGSLAEEILVERIRINGADATGSVVVRPGKTLSIEVDGVARRAIADVQFALTMSSQGVRVATMHDCEQPSALPEGSFTVEYSVPAHLFRPGDYLLGFGAERERVGSWFYGDGLIRITVVEEWAAGFPANRRGLVNLTAEQVAGSRRPRRGELAGDGAGTRGANR
ncbi:MAG: polysaccharide ABC transporter ATP-binding protein [Thermoanaerobaculia bacterium]|jgi:lipopolysaccharide transport system ATP-binding protein